MITCRPPTFALMAALAGPALAHPGGHNAEPGAPGSAVASIANQPTAGRTNPGATQAVQFPASVATITVEGDQRIIRANGIPQHQTGTFPTRGNPNAIRPQSHEIRLPVHPTPAGHPTPARPEFGIAVNGVIFDSGTGEFWTPTQGRTLGARSRWNYEALTGDIDLGIDANNAHVQPTGKYHYHGMPTGLIDRLNEDRDDEQPQMLLVGWAFDGFPIYAEFGYADPEDPESGVRSLEPSYRVRSGARPESPAGPGGEFDGSFTADWEYVDGLGDLDECNGRTGVTPEFPEGTYYYVITDAFPSVPRFWKGEPARTQGSERGIPERVRDNTDRRRPLPRSRRGRSTDRPD
ncbi:MAG: YHYH protein [Planctomycetota bacterium]